MAEALAKKRVRVAIAVVWGGGGEGDMVLICKRKAESVLGGYWEFPGGKCEEGEEPAACARREVKEEVGIEVEVIGALEVIEHDYPHALVRLHPFVCRHVGGEPQCLEVEEAKWVRAGEILGYTFPAANGELVKRVARGRELIMGNG